MGQPLLVTAAIIVDDLKNPQKIFLVKNGRNPNNESYGFPGGVGGFEKTADPAVAVRAEVSGDIGCDFVGAFFTVSYRDDVMPVVTFFYIGTITGDPHPVCKNIVDAQFFPIADARKMHLTYEHNAVLEKIVKSRSLNTS